MKRCWGPLVKLVGLALALLLSVGIYTQRESKTQGIKPSQDQFSSYEVLGDNFSEHLNALTQRLRQVMEDNHKIQNLHQDLAMRLDRITDQSKERSDASLYQKQTQLSLRIQGLEQNLEHLNQKIESWPRGRSDPIELPLIPTRVEDKILDRPVEQGFELIPDQSLNILPEAKPTPSISVMNYTVPSGATLATAMTMSALIGRIPVEGSVKSPYPFKIIIGKENLITNGFILPELQGAIVQGYSVGDLALGCVRGMVTELTFMFPDGSIVNIQSESESLEEFRQALGYISEPDGNPCIAGHFYSNAKEFLTGEVVLGALSGASQGLSLAQEGQRTGAYGDREQYFNGDLAKMILGQAGAQSADQVQAWWLARNQDSFDVVYVPSGQLVVINITRTLHLDHTAEARKLKYETKI